MKTFLTSAAVTIFATGLTIAQVNTINSGIVQPRVFNDVPLATYFGYNNYTVGSSNPWIWMNEEGVSAATGFANRDQWLYSAGGVNPYLFAHNDYFNASFDLTLAGIPTSPRKEAGFVMHSTSMGDLQYIVNTDGHEVVQFGGNTFYSFSASQGLQYNSGDTIHMGMSYFFDHATGYNAIQFFANNLMSPVFDFTPSLGNGALDIGDGTTLGGYFQIVNDPHNPGNSGDALFQNISITSVPEPTMLALLGLGGLAMVLRRRS
jgi:hypothetical protein